MMCKSQKLKKKKDNDFVLQKLQFFENKILSETLHELEGKVVLIEDKMKVYIHCAGLVQEKINTDTLTCKWDNNNQYVIINVILMAVELDEKSEEVLSTFKVGTGSFTAQLPDDERNLRFVKPSKKDFMNIFKVKDGILQFELALAESL